jgi:hypothetical protein
MCNGNLRMTITKVFAFYGLLPVAAPLPITICFTQKSACDAIKGQGWLAQIASRCSQTSPSLTL